MNITKSELRRKKKDLVERKSKLSSYREDKVGETTRDSLLQGRIREINKQIDWINLLIQTG